MRPSSVLLLLLLLCFTLLHVLCTVGVSSSDRSQFASCAWQETDEGASPAQVGADATRVRFCSSVLWIYF